MRTVDLMPIFRASCTLTRAITFVNYSAVEDISAKGQVKIFAAVLLESERFHLGKLVDSSEDRRSCKGIRFGECVDWTVLTRKVQRTISYVLNEACIVILGQSLWQGSFCCHCSRESWC